MYKKTVDFFTAFLLVVFIVLTALLLGGRLFGLKTYTVISGSMEPTYHVGSMIYVKPANGEELSVNDAITYIADGKTAVTHRIVKKDDTARKIVTRGDANNCDDSPISYDDVIGKVKFSVPVLGYIAMWLSTTAGKCCVAGLVVLTVILEFLPGLKRAE